MILEDAFIVTATVGLFTALLNLIGTNIYDVQEARKERQARRHPHARQYRQRPLVSVIVIARDAEAVIERCLQGLVTSSYRKLEIIVIDSASEDNTRRVVRQFKTDHPKRAIRLVARRSPIMGREVLSANVKKHAHGELVLLLTADDLVDKQTVAHVVRPYNSEPAIDMIGLNRHILSKYSTLGLFQQYQALLRQGPQKLMSIAGSAYGMGAMTIAFRREVLLARHTPDKEFMRFHYAGDAVILCTPASSLFSLLNQQYQRQFSAARSIWQQRRLFFRPNGPGRLLTWVCLPLAVCSGLVSLFVPVLISYFIYMAVGLHEPSFLVLSWLAIAMLILTAVWSDARLQAVQKVAYSLCIPITYGLFFILSFVRIFTAGRAILAPKKFLTAR